MKHPTNKPGARQHPRSHRHAGGPSEDPHGILLVDKPAAMTSHDVVDRIRRHFRLRKVGHGGTLDPMATGLLVILIGRGTRLFQDVMSTDKIYEGIMRLGIRTDTHDRDGRILGEEDPSKVTRAQVEEEMHRREGDQLQTPPMTSAVKHGGVPLYKLARRGRTVERKPRLIHVYRFQLLDFQSPNARFRLWCTKGTYVRTLCADIGESLGCGAHLAELRRLASGRLKVENSRPLNEILECDREDFEKLVIPVHSITFDSSAGPADPSGAG